MDPVSHAVLNIMNSTVNTLVDTFSGLLLTNHVIFMVPLCMQNDRGGCGSCHNSVTWAGWKQDKACHIVTLTDGLFSTSDQTADTRSI